MKHLWRKGITWLQYNFRELISFLTAIGFFYVSGKLIQFFDPTSGTFSLGILQTLCFGAATFFTAIFLAWIAISLSFPSVDRFVDADHFDCEFFKLDPPKQVYLTLGLFLGLIYLFIKCCALVAS